MNSRVTGVSEPIIVSLKQVAGWDLEHLDAPCVIKASVPALQRGLVWSPQQVELLWDSLLRGFPIGSLVVGAKLDSQECSGKAGVTHHLLDGQQRCNAIALGYHDPFTSPVSQVRGNKSDSILWIDLAPTGSTAFPDYQFPTSSTREFLVRVTTAAHPWGYRPNDDASRLSASFAREAVEWEFQNKTAPLSRPSPRELLPWHSNAPVPLAWLINLMDEAQPTAEVFWAAIKSRLEESLAQHRWPELALGVLAEGTAKLHSIYNAVLRTVQTRLVVLQAPADILAPTHGESSGNNSVTGIEHLFNRLNRQGTPLGGEELAYSMIKAYWPEVATVIESVTRCRLPASHLASLGIRAALTPTERGKLARPIPIARLRAIATAPQDNSGDLINADSRLRLRIKDFLGANHDDANSQNRLARACALVDQWLGYDEQAAPNGLPPVLISSIARGEGSTYLFLLHLADRLRDDATAASYAQWRDLLPGLATLIHWYANAGETLAIGDLLTESISENVSPESVRKGIAKALAQDLIKLPQPPDKLAAFIQLPEDTDLAGWKWWRSLIEAAPEAERPHLEKVWQPFLQKTVWTREILLYAQRRYLCSRFPDYDPSRKDLWEGHNRPWDFDHLHASAFFYNAKSGIYADLCREWGNSIGNLRAWPFEENRSDQKSTAKEKLGGKPDEMMASLVLSEQELGAFSYGDHTRSDPGCARELCEAIKARLVRIYGDWYHSTGIASLLSAHSENHNGSS